MTAGRTSPPDESAGATPAGATPAGLPARIAFLGFGLIGGSVARALRAAGTRAELVAWTPDGRGSADGLGAGLLDRVAGSPRDALHGAGLVVLAGPPLAILATLDDLAGPLHAALAADATITDVASTKASIVERAGTLGLPFVGGHPMAGVEASGVAASTADLFVDRPWVVIPAASARDRDVARVDALVAAVGARAVRLSPRDHDDAVAAISHLPLVVAAALVEAVAAAPGDRGDAPADEDRRARWLTARELAAGGWASMTRLARGDPAMGAGILATNAGPVVARLRDLRRAIDAWIEALEASPATPQGPDAAALARRLTAARAALEEDGR